MKACLLKKKEKKKEKKACTHLAINKGLNRDAKNCLYTRTSVIALYPSPTSQPWRTESVTCEFGDFSYRTSSNVY
jgi:hypothetical protein